MSHIEINALRKRYPNGAGLARLDLTIEHGEFFVLLGPSGCGKTTALRCLAGLEIPDSGWISLDNTRVVEPQQGRFVAPQHRMLGMVFQSYALWPHMTVAQNVAYPLKARRYSRSARVQAVEDALTLVDLNAVAHRYPGELSGGQQQRVALARALAARPTLVLFDEPLSNLDAQLRIRLRQELRRVHHEVNYTAVYVTHDQDEALALADRIAVMRDGRIEQLGTPVQIFQHPETRFVAEFVGFDNFLSGRVRSTDKGSMTVAVPGLAHPVNARAIRHFAVGEPVELAIRSGNLQWSLTGDRLSANTVPVALIDAQYQGDAYQCVFSCSTGIRLNSRLSVHQWHEMTSSVPSSEGGFLHFPADALVALPVELLSTSNKLEELL